MHIRWSALCLVALCALPLSPGLAAQDVSETPPVEEAYRESAARILQAALADSTAWDRLAELTDTFGPRFSGTASLEAAIDWIVAQMHRDGLDNVRKEPVLVPRWVRGEESLRLIEPRAADVPVLGLGGSVGTPDGGLTAEVLVVSSFEDLERRADEARGKIVLFNMPFTTYGTAVRYRVGGAVAAARAGAVASLIRSVAPYSLRTPHTGSLRYEDDAVPIPHAAIPTEDADMLARFQSRGIRVAAHLDLEAETLPDATSHNVIAEIEGYERPEEVVVLGGHIDSWDVGTGAVDDAGGCVAAWEALNLLKQLGLRPRRTIRAVLWTNEENGLRGARTYRDNLGGDIQHHVLAIESDAGVFAPSGFGFSGSDEALGVLQRIGSLLAPIGAEQVTRGGGGADIGPLMRDGVPGMGLVVDPTRYFWYHHTEADTVDKIDPHELNRCIAALAVMAYVTADMDLRLPRATP